MNKSKDQSNTSKKSYIDSSGKIVNDYIPSYISNAPWYTSSTPLSNDSNIRKRKSDEERINEINRNDRLKHQRLDPNSEPMANNEPKKGLGINDKFIEIKNTIDTTIATTTIDDKKQREKWKKKVREWKKRGRCENCGGKHQKSDCLEKPHTQSFILKNDKRDANANANANANVNNHTSILIRAEDGDEKTNYDASRDRWHGYDNEAGYDEIVSVLEKKERLMIDKYVKEHNLKEDDNERKDKDLLLKALLEKNGLKSNDQYTGRSLDEKPRYLEVIKTGEELRYNPKSRVYKDLNDGYLNERGQFIPYLTGEAAEFEKMKKFTRSIQNEQRSKAQEDSTGTVAVANTQYTSEFNPTQVMIKLKEKEQNDKIIRETKKQQLLAKYGMNDDQLL